MRRSASVKNRDSSEQTRESDRPANFEDKKSVTMGVQLPFVSVIVPVYGEIGGFGWTLTALHEQSYPNTRYEVIVIDNGAFSALDELVANLPRVVLLSEHRKGSYCARNTGLKHARGDVIAFTDADCRPARTWIEQGVRALEEAKNVGLVAGRVAVTFASAARPAAAEVYDCLMSFPQELTIERYHYGATANLFTSRTVVEKVGQFDCSRLSGGDCEWGRRVYEHGFRQVYCEAAVVRHPARKSLSSVIAKSRRVTIGTMNSLAHPEGKTWAPSNWYYQLISRPGKLWSQMSLYYSRLGMATRSRVMGIYYLIKLIQLGERIRVVWMGGKPER